MQPCYGWRRGGKKNKTVKRILTGSFEIETRVKQTEGGGGGVEP